MNINDPSVREHLTHLIYASNHTFVMPCWGDYLIWNDLMYSLLEKDKIRNHAFQRVIDRMAEDQIIAEIGCGADLLLTQMCLNAGARRIYAIEINESSCQRARQLIRDQGWENRIQLISGSSFATMLPEPVDLVLSEVIGSIGSSEGVSAILRDARRFLKPAGKFIPDSCLTWIAPIHMPDNIYRDPILDAIFKQQREAMEAATADDIKITRYEIFNFPISHFIGHPLCFEELRFNPELSDTINSPLLFTVDDAAELAGLALWIDLYIAPGERVNSLSKSNWGAVYFAMPPIDLIPNDIIQIESVKTVGDKGINPDYTFTITVIRQNRTIHRHEIVSQH